jgi:hypothetical protein
VQSAKFKLQRHGSELVSVSLVTLLCIVLCVCLQYSAMGPAGRLQPYPGSGPAAKESGGVEWEELRGVVNRL